MAAIGERPGTSHSRRRKRDRCSAAAKSYPSAEYATGENVTEEPEMDDDLDYYISFPAPNAVTDNDFDFSSHVEPVVLLLGWSGCDDRHLSKYGALYENAGYTGPLMEPFMDSSGSKIAEKLLNLFAEYGFDDNNPVFIHTFSNGGAYIYRSIAKLLSTERKYSQLCVLGTIFDSSPVPLSISSGSKALSVAIGANFLLSYLITLVFGLYVTVRKWFHNIASFFWSSEPNPMEKFMHEMQQDRLACPQLFLFSKADEISDATYIFEHMEIRRSLGVSVDFHCWEDSPHVSHFRIYPEEYKLDCLNFLQNCIDSFIELQYASGDHREVSSDDNDDKVWNSDDDEL